MVGYGELGGACAGGKRGKVIFRVALDVVRRLLRVKEGSP
jgi:hypothetical protein